MEMKTFIVKLFDGMDRVIEEYEVKAKGKKTAMNQVKFKQQIGSNYYIIATQKQD